MRNRSHDLMHHIPRNIRFKWNTARAAGDAGILWTNFLLLTSKSVFAWLTATKIPSGPLKTPFMCDVEAASAHLSPAAPFAPSPVTSQSCHRRRLRAPAGLAVLPAPEETVESQDSQGAEHVHDASWSSGSGWRQVPEEPHLVLPTSPPRALATFPRN